MTKFRIFDGGKQADNPFTDAEYGEALTDTEYAAAIRRLVKLDGELQAHVDDLRLINARAAIKSVAMSRGIEGAIKWLKGELRHLERLGESVR